jgi:hypothetical protein
MCCVFGTLVSSSQGPVFICLILAFRSGFSVMHTRGEYCLKDDCRNLTDHKSGFCKDHRTFICPKCKKTHTLNEAISTKAQMLCAYCRKTPKNVRDFKDGKYD